MIFVKTKEGYVCMYALLDVVC